MERSGHQKSFNYLLYLNQAVPNYLADASHARSPDTPPDHPFFFFFELACTKRSLAGSTCRSTFHVFEIIKNSQAPGGPGAVHAFRSKQFAGRDAS